MATQSRQVDVGKMTFEDALGELETIVQKLEQGEGGLEDAIRAYERGEQLKQHCETKLTEARARIEKIVKGADGATGTEPLDGE